MIWQMHEKSHKLVNKSIQSSIEILTLIISNERSIKNAWREDYGIIAVIYVVAYLFNCIPHIVLSPRFNKSRGTLPIHMFKNDTMKLIIQKEVFIVFL